MVKGDAGGTEEAARTGSEVRWQGKEYGPVRQSEKGRAQMLGEEIYSGGRRSFHLETSACSYSTVLPRPEGALAHWYLKL